jgi:hypothetical membrane protein
VPSMRAKRRPVRASRSSWLVAAGVLLFLAAVVGLLGIITAEALYPSGYSTGKNAISDLGATEPPNSRIEEPAASVFNTAMIVCGGLALTATLFLQRGSRRWLAPALLGLYALGVLGVGAFPGNTGNVHAVFALLAFIAGGLACLASVTIAARPFAFLGVLLGLVSLVVLLLAIFAGDSGPLAGLGIGGQERWVAYPVLLWIAALGGHLAARVR